MTDELFIFVAAAWMILRLTGLFRTRSSARREQAPSRTSRVAEVVMLLCIGMVYWIYRITHVSVISAPDGFVFLDHVRANLISIVPWVVLFLIYILCSCLYVIRGGSSIGMYFGFVLLMLNVSHLNDLTKYAYSLVGAETSANDRMLRFECLSGDLQGAELYVNGIRIGELTLTISASELKSRVPYWSQVASFLSVSEVPEEFKSYSRSMSRSTRTNSLYQLVRSPLFDESKWRFYAQVKYRGQWCYGVSNAFFLAPEGHHGRELVYQLRFICLALEQQIEQLMDRARIKDYQVSDAWFDSMESHGRNGILALLMAEPNEPGMTDLLDQWTSRRFGLIDVRDEATAWRAFETICQRVIQAQAYSTEGLEGRAVAWLAPRLSADRLASQAVKLLRDTDFLNWKSWQIGKTQHFGMGYNGARMMVSNPEVSSSYGSCTGQLPVQGYAVAHAMWILFKQGDSKTKAVLQDLVVPAFVEEFYKDLPQYHALSVVGGPVLERFLLRENWQVNCQQLPESQVVEFNGEEQNG